MWKQKNKHPYTLPYDVLKALNELNTIAIYGRDIKTVSMEDGIYIFYYESDF